MPTGKQGPPTGLAKRFAEYLKARISEHGWNLDYVASETGMSKNYIATRLRAEAIFNLRDFERVAKMLGLDAQEMLARIEFEPAAHYDGKLIPEYGVSGDRTGIHIFRAVDADPPLRGNVIEAPFGRVGGATEDLKEVANHTIAEDTPATDADYDNA